ncbi:MAG: PIN domain-containing protein [Actinobacteria bacterium]|nr:PIN domain-containing protein [Actinomycetota bacterium]
MSCFADTSAFYSLLDADDSNHLSSKARWTSLLEERNVLVTSNYVLLEVFALLQNRLGINAVRSFQENIVPMIAVELVHPEIHSEGLAVLLSSGRRGLSLVDCTSFAIMRKLGIRQAFAFDRHFKEQGFNL